MTRKIVVKNLSQPYNNPNILAEGLNPIRAYEADVIENGRVIETLTGVIFANQTTEDQITHHALLRGYGKLPLSKGIKSMERRR